MRVVNVERTIVVKYWVPISAYDGMSDAKIREWETSDESWDIEDLAIQENEITSSSVITFGERDE